MSFSMSSSYDTQTNPLANPYFNTFDHPYQPSKTVLIEQKKLNQDENSTENNLSVSSKSVAKIFPAGSDFN